MIVAQVRDLLMRLASEEDLSVLVVEQNIGVATSVSDPSRSWSTAAINRIMAAERTRAATATCSSGCSASAGMATRPTPAPRRAPLGVGGRGRRVFASRGTARRDRATTRSPSIAPISLPNRWGVRQAAPRDAPTPREPAAERASLRHSVRRAHRPHGARRRHVRHQGRRTPLHRATGCARSTFPSAPSISRPRARCRAPTCTPMQVAAMHPRGSGAVFSGDRGAGGRRDGRGLRALDRARARHRRRDFGRRLRRHDAGDRRHAPAARSAFRRSWSRRSPPARSANMSAPADIMMMYSVADVQGLNPITEQVLGNAAHALAGMISRSADRRGARGAPPPRAAPPSASPCSA